MAVTDEEVTLADARRGASGNLGPSLARMTPLY